MDQVYKSVCTTLMARKMVLWRPKNPFTQNFTRPDAEVPSVEPRPKLFFPLGYMNPMQEAFWPEVSDYHFNVYYQVRKGLIVCDLSAGGKRGGEKKKKGSDYSS